MGTSTVEIRIARNNNSSNRLPDIGIRIESQYMHDTRTLLSQLQQRIADFD